MMAARTSKRNVEIRGLPGLVGVEGFTVRIIATEWVSGPLVLVVLPAMVIVWLPVDVVGVVVILSVDVWLPPDAMLTVGGF